MNNKEKEIMVDVESVLNKQVLDLNPIQISRLSDIRENIVKEQASDIVTEHSAIINGGVDASVNQWFLLGGLIAASCAAVILVVSLSYNGAGQYPSYMADLDLLLSVDELQDGDPRFYVDMQFYDWLATREGWEAAKKM